MLASSMCHYILRICVSHQGLPVSCQWVNLFQCQWVNQLMHFCHRCGGANMYGKIWNACECNSWKSPRELNKVATVCTIEFCCNESKGIWCLFVCCFRIMTELVETHILQIWSSASNVAIAAAHICNIVICSAQQPGSTTQQPGKHVYIYKYIYI